MTITVPETYTYLDWAATTPLCEEAAQAMAPFLAPGLANVGLGMNANSLHAPGRAAFEQLELARRSVARSIGASRPNEVVFTSGATESCNAAVIGIAHAKAKELRKQQDALRKQQEAERKAREKAEKKKEKSGPSFFDLLFSDSDNNNA